MQQRETHFLPPVIPMMPAAEVPPANRAEYSSLLDVVFRLANDLDNKLAVFSVVTKSEENTRKLLSAVCLITIHLSFC